MSDSSHATPEERLEKFNQLLDSIPFERVISWVFAAPEPRQLSWWKRWWKS